MPANRDLISVPFSWRKLSTAPAALSDRAMLTDRASTPNLMCTPALQQLALSGADLAENAICVCRLHKGVHIGRGLGPEVDMVGVLVHVEREDRHATGERVRMIRGPLIDELAITRRPGQERPSRATRERLAHCDELRAPALIRTEVPSERLFQCETRLTLLP